MRSLADRARRSLRLIGLSWGVLRKDRELLALPALSAVVSLAAAGLAVLAAALLFPGVRSGTGGGAGSAALLVLAGGLVGVGVVRPLFAGALVGGAHERLTGGDPTVLGSLRLALRRLPALAGWATIDLVVGAAINALTMRRQVLGGWAGRSASAAWSASALLTVPAIVVDGEGPISGYKRSAGMLRRTWGENLAVRAGINGAAVLAVCLPLLPLLAAGVGTEEPAGWLLPYLIACLAWTAAVSMATSALNGIVRAALYVYATTGAVPAGFDGRTLDAGVVSSR